MLPRDEFLYNSLRETFLLLQLFSVTGILRIYNRFDHFMYVSSSDGVHFKENGSQAYYKLKMR